MTSDENFTSAAVRPILNGSLANSISTDLQVLKLDYAEQLVHQRQLLRRKLLAQRIQIAHLISPPNKQIRAYPRSMTMRFIMQRPTLAVSILAKFAALIADARIFKPILTATFLAALVRLALTHSGLNGHHQASP